MSIEYPVIITGETRERFKWSNTWRQHFATLTIDLIMFSHGAAIAWATTAMPILESKDTPLLSGPLPTEQISWLGSINLIGGFIGALSFGFIISLTDTKRTTPLLSLGEIAFWLLIYFAPHYYYILIATVIAGFSGSGFMAVVLFVAEIANNEIRGRLSAIVYIFSNLGVMASYILGTTLDYYTIPCVCIAFPIIFFCIFIMLPNTPQYHLRRGQFNKAEKSLKFYKGYKGGSVNEDNALFVEFERLKLLASKKKMTEKVQLSELLSRDALKSFAICFLLVIFQNSSCDYAIQIYALQIYGRTGNSVEPFVLLLTLSSALIVGCVLSSYFADKLGRKKLIVISLCGSAIGLFAMALYHYSYISGYNLATFGWLPVVALPLVVFIAACGISSLIDVSCIEQLPSKIRNSSYLIVVLWQFTCPFISLKFFPILLDAIDVHSCMIAYGSLCVLGNFFVIFVMEDTTGKRLDDVASQPEATNN